MTNHECDGGGVMDEELKELAALALRNAFWKDFSALVNVYLEAAAGLNINAQERMMGELTSVYGRDLYVKHTPYLSVYSIDARGVKGGYGLLCKDLNDPHAQVIYMNSMKVFERRNGEWFFVDERP